MSNTGGPWERDRPQRRPLRRRVGLAALGVAALCAFVAVLIRLFPEGLRTGADWSDLLYLAGVLAIVSAGLVRVARRPSSERLRHMAAWAAIVAVLALGFAYREELAGVPQHLRLAFSAGDPVPVGDHELVVPQDGQGAFTLVGRVNGQRVRFVVDTGATDTVLSLDDARRIGLDVSALRFDEAAETANGRTYGAPYVARRLEVGPIGFDDFRMSVNQAPMSSSLLGLSFLNRLESFEVRGRRLILKWRDGARA